MSRARIAGAVYLLVFVAGITSLVVSGRVGSSAAAIAGLLYIAVTILFYGLFKPVNQRLSLIAAAVSLLGIAVGPMLKVNPLPLFGVYCLLIGYLIVRSANVPRFLGMLMALAGLGWLTFLSSSLSSHLSRYNFGPASSAKAR